jgi:ABC-2 type transport system ATP-binding protein
MKAVDELDLEIQAGEIHGLLGPNGAGKTTTIRMALNIYAPDTGTVRLFGGPPSRQTADRIGYMPEERGLYTKMRVHDLLVFLAALKGLTAREARPRVSRWLERMDLADRRDKRVQDLSKGMQQKVQFIGTILHEPDLIVLDEPFSGLDPINTNMLKNIMVELRQAGRTIIFSTHIMEQAERLCDSICLINGGRKVLEGSLVSVRRRYGHNAVALAYEGDGSFLRTHDLVRGVNDYNSYVEVRLADGADPQRLLADLVGRLRVKRFEIVEPSLHDIFIQRVGETSPTAAGREIARG